METSREIKKIPKRKGIIKQRPQRVCAYIRVSTGHEAQLNSLENQKQYFERLITSRSDYQFCGIYSDAGVSGIKSDRPGFNAMMAAARKQEIDLIITKTISRFARNTMLLLQSIRELKLLGVGVIFEENHIHTLHAEGELMLTVLGSLAEEECKSVSENIKWSLQKNYKAGNTMHDPNRVYGYTVDANRNPMIKQDEAEIVKRVFNRYLVGVSGYQIAKDLNDANVPTGTEMPWQSARILRIISNEKYVGDCVLQKTFVDEKGRQIPNQGQLEKYYVHGFYPPIIDRKKWNKAQQIRKGRVKKSYPLSGRLLCPNCRQTLIRVIGYQNQVFWVCKSYMHYGKSVCKGIRVKEAFVLELMNDYHLLNDETQIIVEEEYHGEKHHQKTKNDFSLKPVTG